jgi:hypothetical protein
MGNIVAIVYTRIYNQQGSLQKEAAKNKRQFTMCLRNIRINVDNGNRWKTKASGRAWCALYKSGLMRNVVQPLK